MVQMRKPILFFDLTFCIPETMPVSRHSVFLQAVGRDQQEGDREHSRRTAIREWIIAGRVMGSLCYDKRNQEFCWWGAWFVTLENDTESMNLIGPLSRFSITIRNAIFEYQETGLLTILSCHAANLDVGGSQAQQVIHRDTPRTWNVK
jgi:hypothetical protein